VIAPDLMKEFGIGPQALGMLGGIFFYAFALAQFPIGPLLDRIGPRTVVTVFAIIGSMGAILFAASTSYSMALGGRILLGVGMAAMLMGTLKTFAVFLPVDKFSRSSGVLVSIGTLGTLLAASPLAYASRLIGWRTTFFATGTVTLLLGLLVFKCLKTSSTHCKTETSGAEPVTTGHQPFSMILRSLSFWQISAAAFCRYGTFVSLQGVWLALYLVDIASYSTMQAANLLLLIGAGMVVGSPCAGWLYDRAVNYKKAVVIFGLGAYCLTLLPLVRFSSFGSYFLHAALCFCMGFFSGFGMLVYSYAKDSFPIEVSGTAMSWVNFFIMLGGAVFMQVTGAIIQLFPSSNGAYGPNAYHSAFLVCFLFMAASLIFFAFARPVKATGA